MTRIERWILAFLLLFGLLQTEAATINIKNEPLTNAIFNGDLLIVDSFNQPGAGQYQTHVIDFSNFLNFVSGNITVISNSVTINNNLTVLSNAFFNILYSTSNFVQNIITTNITVISNAHFNHTIITNLTIYGAETNVNILNSVVETDPNGKYFGVPNQYGILTNGGAGSGDIGFAAGVPTIDLSAGTNITGGNVKGGTKTIEFDASYFWPGDTLTATWTTNTPGAGSASIQSAGPSFKAWQFSTSATNNILLEILMPADWDGNTSVNWWVSLVSGTNSAVANAITNIWSVSMAKIGTALGTAVTITNNLPGGTGLIYTNFDLASMVIAGSPKPGDYCLAQFQAWGGKTPFSSTNVLYLVAAGLRYNVTNVQNKNVVWP